MMALKEEEAKPMGKKPEMGEGGKWLLLMKMGTPPVDGSWKEEEEGDA
jgi:hypothetical protein